MKVAVVQPAPGIGDMVWFVPHIRSISKYFGGPVTLVAKPSTLADQLFNGDCSVSEIIWLDRNPRQGKGCADGIGLIKMAIELRARNFDAVYLLHHSKSLSFMLWLARIPNRYGYGEGIQRLFQNRTSLLPESFYGSCMIEKAQKWLEISGIPFYGSPGWLKSRRPLTHLFSHTIQTPYVVFGIGASESYKQWGALRFAELAASLLNAGWNSIALIGGGEEADLAEDICNRLSSQQARVITILGRHLSDVIVLCSHAGFCVGNDTGILNLAVATGIKAYGLFGATPPMVRTSQLVEITPQHGLSKTTGMADISSNNVLQAIIDDRDGAGPQHG